MDANETTQAGASVLIADGNARQRMLIELMLSPYGYQLVLLADGRDVVTYLKQHTPAVVILEAELPLVSGLEISSKMTCISRLAGVPVILVTPSVEELKEKPALREELKRAEVELVLPKPLGDKDLRGRLENLLAKKEEAAASASTLSKPAVQGSTAPELARPALELQSTSEDEAQALRAQLAALEKEMSEKLSDERAKLERLQAESAEQLAEIEELKKRNKYLLAELERREREEPKLRPQRFPKRLLTALSILALTALLSLLLSLPGFPS